ncbi:Histone-lysine N-methyltransferase SETMAR [Habropoda laboriosa]|uniref:Histone-lysine N-methyltransferase SETMAR n=1 Tax=Habropoda laboriosa TaxID=597456 RepID=A0A0L7RFZ9_9HYME|nr:Histone-lysine N-methyltransferase SETMAR [Habropoda laboriosa]
MTSIVVLPHPPYSIVLVPSDFHFFRSLDNFLIQKEFSKQEDIENAFQQYTSFGNSDSSI